MCAERPGHGDERSGSAGHDRASKTKSKILVALTILLAMATVVLAYAVMDSSVSYTYCADELERLTRRGHTLVGLMGSLEPKPTKTSLTAAVRKAGLQGEVIPKGPNEVVVSDVSFVFDDAGVLREVLSE